MNNVDIKNDLTIGRIDCRMNSVSIWPRLIKPFVGVFFANDPNQENVRVGDILDKENP